MQHLNQEVFVLLINYKLVDNLLNKWNEYETTTKGTISKNQVNYAKTQAKIHIYHKTYTLVMANLLCFPEESR